MPQSPTRQRGSRARWAAVSCAPTTSAWPACTDCKGRCEAARGGADAIVVAAGMDGALPSVVAGLVDVPVIGLPTSIGYGLGGGGVAALMSMLQTCAPGLVVVNIDNGVGAGATAALFANRVAAARAR